MPTVPSFLGLPEEVVLKVFSHLDFAAKRTIHPLVCKRFQQVTAPSAELWSTVVLDPAQEDNAFSILQRVGLTGGVVMEDNTCITVKRDAVMRWFRKHATVISDVVSSGNNDGNTEFEFDDGGLSAGLIAARYTLKRLVLQESDWVRSDPFCDDLAWLTNLQTLELRQASFGDMEVELEGLSCLVGLESLILAGDLGSGKKISMPDSLFQLRKLKFLEIRDMRIKGFSGQPGSLVSLNQLTMSGLRPPIADALEQIVQLSSLQYLTIKSSPIQRLPEIWSLGDIRELNISYCGLRELPSFDNMTSLLRLNLGSNQLTRLPILAPLKKLRQLLCYENNFPVLSVVELAGLDLVYEISFRRCGFMDIPETVVALVDLPQLGIMTIQGCKLTALGVVAVVRLVDAFRRKQPDVEAVLSVPGRSEFRVESGDAAAR